MYVELAILSVSVLSSVVLFVRQKYSFWSSRNVPFIKPKFPFGNFKDINQRSIADVSVEMYNQLKAKERFFGLYFFLEPILMVCNLDTVKSVLIKDFNYAPDRGIFHNQRDDPVSAHLFAIEGEKWRSLRNRLSPTFTSGKMRLMFNTVKAVADNYSEYLTKSIGSGKEVEMKDYVARFTVDIIASCAFGLEANSFTDPDNTFRRVGQQVIEKPKYLPMVRIFLKLFPDLGRKLRLKVVDEAVTSFFYKLIEDTVKYREQNGVKRNDFLRLLMKMKSRMTMDEIVAQSFVFFGAGFETSSSNQMYCLYELALNQEHQEKARASVLQALEKHGGLTYEAVSDMKYLDQCINETLRLYPSLPILERKTAKPYRLPDSQVVLPTNTKIYIPAFAIHRDEQVYPNPLVFDPDRFRPEEVAKRHNCTFLPFGEGPRACIGLRFGMLQSRLGLATVLSKYRVTPCPQTTIPLEYSATALVLQPKGKLWLKLEPLENK